MEIQRNNYSPAFGIKFTKNKAMQEVIQYAVDNKCTRTLDGALNTLSKIDDGTVSILHGKTTDGNMYSTFTTGRRSVCNRVNDVKSPAEASFEGIIELSMLSKKLKSLLGVSNVEDKITAERLMKDYTV